MEYNIILSDSANHDLNSIFDYISNKIHDDAAAGCYADHMEKVFKTLANQHKIFPLSENLTLRKREYRPCIIDDFSMLYRVDDLRQEIFISRFFFGRYNYSKYL